jgi:hypothetical protein
MRGLQADIVSYTAFRDALHDLAEAPTATNVRRYLVASRKLGTPASAVRGRKKPRRRITG